MSNITAKEMIELFLRLNKFDGLCNPDMECGCDVSDLFPCDGFCGDCQAAYKITITDEGRNVEIYSTTRGGGHHVVRKSEGGVDTGNRPESSGEEEGLPTARDHREIPPPDGEEAEA